MIRDIWYTFPFWLQIATIVFVAVWAIQLFFMLFVRMRPLWRFRKERLHKVPMTDELPPISVIVYAHNQAEVLQHNLPVLLDSHYPDFEVIVVDDGSTDDTESVLTQMDQRSEHFFHTTISERVQTVSRRKLAMLLGVKAAHNDIVLMTQAQCVPTSYDWLTSMGRLFTPEVDAVIGPVVYENRVGIMNRFFQWDFFDRLISMMGMTLAVNTYGGWCYNMAFRKETFFADKNRAIQQHLALRPGEDDLFLTQITKKHNVTVACSSEAVVINQQSPIHYCWKRERLHRAFTHRYYFQVPSLLFNLETLTRYLTVLLGALVIVWASMNQSWWVLGIAAFLLFANIVTYDLIPYFISKKLGIHRYKITPIVAALITPLVDMYFYLYAVLRSHQFYVGRID